MNITSQQVNELRQKTGLGMMNCKKALEESGGDPEKAIDILRKKGIAKAGEKATRATAKGLVVSYIHANNVVGTLVEVNCETDFVARTESFQEFCKDIAMHIAAANPTYLTPDEVPSALLEKEKEIYAEQMANEGKPAEIVQKIITAKLEKYKNEMSLMTQPYVKNPDVTIADFVHEMIGKTGENIQISRFARFSLNA